MNEIKILPWVPTHSQHARNVFTGDILVFNILGFGSKQLVYIFVSPSPSSVASVEFFNYCVSQIYVCSEGMTTPPSWGWKDPNRWVSSHTGGPETLG